MPKIQNVISSSKLRHSLHTGKRCHMQLMYKDDEDSYSARKLLGGGQTTLKPGSRIDAMRHKLADTDNLGTRGQNYNPWTSPLRADLRFLLVPWKYKTQFEKKDCVPMLIQSVPGRFLRGCRRSVVI
ncbi:hypothetical protein MDA_GLEAN10023149 [Myotis davidii]|uniref:Uncharacterized protein n=1 Tax=Myotis davidii TaxID=225400 RepID=L5LGK5_MYODS|nr:hypothetical protein MDA_GLEAN10023149 [Myotis davidii]